MFCWFLDASRRLRQAFQISIDRSMGLAFYKATLLPARYRGGGFFGDHGSWNRNPRSGYKVIFALLAGGARPACRPLFSAASSMGTVTRAVVPSVSRSTGPGRCRSQTASEMRGGAYRRQAQRPPAIGRTARHQHGHRPARSRNAWRSRVSCNGRLKAERIRSSGIIINSTLVPHRGGTRIA